MSLAEYKKHFGEHTLMGPRGVVVLSKVQHPLRDAPLDELAQGQFRNLVSHCRRKISTLSVLFGGSSGHKALVIANLIAQSQCALVMVTKDYFRHCDIGALPRLFADLESQNVMLFFDEADALLAHDSASTQHHIDKDALLKLVTLRQGVTVFSIHDEELACAMKLRTNSVIEIATS